MAWPPYTRQNLVKQIPLVNSLKNISTSSVPHSFPTTVYKSTWSLTNTQIGGPATPVPGQWGKYIANPKEKVWLELFSSACFISTIDFWFHCWQSNFHIRTFTFDQFFNMNATFLTLGKPVQFSISCSLQTWQKWSLCLQLIQDHQKDKHCRWFRLSHVLPE